MTGIITATKIEANLIIDRLADREESEVQGKMFYKGHLDRGVPVVICICGVGKVNAAHGTTLLIERFRPEFVYIIGVGGAYPSSGLKIGDVAVADKEIYGDEGMMIGEEFHPMDKLLGVTGGIQDSEFRIQNEFPMFIPENLKGCKTKGNFVTVSSCTGTREKGVVIENRFKAVCENMEGAAIAQVCVLNNVPATEIRGISNIIEDRTAGPLNRDDIILAAENAQRAFLIKIFTTENTEQTKK